MKTDAKSIAEPEDDSWFASDAKVYPMAVKGTFRRIKWAILFITLGIYYFLPFVRWDRGPNFPDQAVLVDFDRARAYFFFIEIWPQEVYYLTGLLIIAAIGLFLMNAVAGRLWCGYLCPQTVWTDLFLKIEHWTEGDRRKRIALDKQPWTTEKIARKGAKHFLWLMVAWWTGGAWVLYFADAPTLVKDLATLQAPLAAYVWIGILTFTTYSLAGFMREQVCTYMCPWPRIQAALTDEYALNVSYRYDRGEPRMHLKEAKKKEAVGEAAGDCIDCNQCVWVCPTGVDIRDGSQLGCIQCGLCIDACNTIMDKVDKPRGLIGYDTDDNMNRRERGDAPVYRIIRPRTIVYTLIIAGIGFIMLYALLGREMSGLTVVHDRNPLYVNLREGAVRNGYTIRLYNRHKQPEEFQLSLAGMPEGSRLQVVGVESQASSTVNVEVEADTTREIRVLVFSPKGSNLPSSSPMDFVLHDPQSGETTTISDFFRTGN
ncbi:cytochrome c oxidase accessory protein CcoG [Pseudovibrio hongkongensis]|uniref:cytochrome c oxidase accessory protein CcoG n=1 Tax=Polycladidibacter hongkongensis TaxID=1647556 RepID=UPI000A6F0AD6|nr:cytochrome c oxidase accessory protein CcoG [Pseudovibrio hongkongensis]